MTPLGRGPAGQDLDELVRVVDCAGCGRITITRSTPPEARNAARAIRRSLRVEAGRIKGRPYCGPCLRPEPVVR